MHSHAVRIRLRLSSLQSAATPAVPIHEVGSGSIVLISYSVGIVSPWDTYADWLIIMPLPQRACEGICTLRNYEDKLHSSSNGIPIVYFLVLPQACSYALRFSRHARVACSVTGSIELDPTGQSHMNFGYPRRIERRRNYFISFRATDHLDTSMFSHLDGAYNDDGFIDGRNAPPPFTAAVMWSGLTINSLFVVSNDSCWAKAPANVNVSFITVL